MILSAAQPAAELPGAALLGITWAAGVAVLALAVLVDVAAGKRLKAWRMGAAGLIYFSGWLTTLAALGAPEWWDDWVTDPNWRLGWQLAGAGAQLFIGLAIAGLFLGRWTPAGPVAHDKMGLSHADAAKARVTGPVVGWTFLAALLSMAIPADASFAKVTHTLSAPGDAIGATAVQAAISAVGEGRTNGTTPKPTAPARTPAPTPGATR